MYLPLAGFDPDREKNRRKMSINSVGAAHNPNIVQPTSAADRTRSHAEKIETTAVPSRDQHTQWEKPEAGNTEAVDNFYSAPSLSTQDFMVLKAQTHDDQFQALDDAIARIKENTEKAGDLIEALQKMSEAADPDNLALQLLTKTLEAMEESAPKK